MLKVKHAILELTTTFMANHVTRYQSFVDTMCKSNDLVSENSDDLKIIVKCICKQACMWMNEYIIFEE